MKFCSISIFIALVSATAFAGESEETVDTSSRPYWKRFNNPELEGMIERALTEDFDVAAAVDRIEQAQAVARQALAPLLPTVSAEGSWRLNSYNRVGSGVETPVTPVLTEAPDTMQNMMAVLKASYVVDIVGRQVATRQAALDDARAVSADADALAIALIAQIVRSYFDVVTAIVRIRVIDEQIQNNTKLLEVLEMRFRAGTSSALEVLQQRQQLAATQANRPLILTLLETSRLQLAALLGDPDTSRLPDFPDALPDIENVTNQLNADAERSVRELPQIRAARLRVDALEQREKSALRTMMPTLSVSGQLGWVANYGNRFDDGEVWNIGVLLSVPIYQGGALRSGLHAARAATRAGDNALQSVTVHATARIQIAAALEEGQRARLKALKEHEEVAAMMFEQAESSYLVGLSDYLSVLAAVNALQALELNVLQTQRDILDAQISLMSAMGGDWTLGIATSGMTRQ